MTQAPLTLNKNTSFSVVLEEEPAVRNDFSPAFKMSPTLNADGFGDQDVDIQTKALIEQQIQQQQEYDCCCVECLAEQMYGQEMNRKRTCTMYTIPPLSLLFSLLFYLATVKTGYKNA